MLKSGIEQDLNQSYAALNKLLATLRWGGAVLSGFAAEWRFALVS